MEKAPLEFGPISTGSILTSSEGLVLTGMLTLVTSICTGDFPVQLQMVAIASMGVALGAYAIARGVAKRAE